MILSKNVLISLNSLNYKHYECLGYTIPKYYDKSHKTYRIKNGTKINVKIEHLTNGSNVKVLIKCDNCGLTKYYKYCYIKKSGKYLCCKCACNTNEYKNKISQIHKNRKFTEEHKIKLSENNGMKGKFGKDNPNYKSWITDKERQRCIAGMYNWKRIVKKNYNYTCQKCGYKGKEFDGKLIVHHINNWSQFKEQRTDINNGIILCKACHKSLHKIYGKLTNQKDISLFLKPEDFQHCL